MTRRRYPVLTRDPITGGELIVTRLEGPESGVVIEGEFTLGWIARLTPDQLDFVGVLVRNRGNVQKVAVELGVAYNTARARLDDIVTSLGGAPDAEPPAPPPAPGPSRIDVLQRLRDGEIDFQTAMRLIEEGRR
ncbi:DUF2089 domain-containing protein [Deinococcus yavapaiensis]|uniref:Fis family transcriptional regulator n=1 Tax=Deinococcus yavapaiensis KR-236 TaxID=694435 RepID=A0A318S553_9DEIO|nr:DUF2089 domain-containing protein [Deinococcus yavapaiensis]PYE52735.1 hypothetical protein DES52_11256 [Deinococcus yavapaiensis KR-236]